MQHGEGATESSRACRTSRILRHRVGQHTTAHSRQIGPGERASPESVQPVQLQGSSSPDRPTVHSRDSIAAAAYTHYGVEIRRVKVGAGLERLTRTVNERWPQIL